MSEIEPTNEVGPTDDVIGIQKPKCIILESQDVLDPVQLFSLPPSSTSLVNLEPANLQDIHPVLA